MADVTYTPPAGFLTLGQAQVRLNISRTTMYRLLREDKLRTYEDQRNKRVKLVKVEDVDRLIEPLPSEGEGKNRAA